MLYLKRTIYNTVQYEWILGFAFTANHNYFHLHFTVISLEVSHQFNELPYSQIFISYQYHMIERKKRFIAYHLPLHVDTLEKEKLQEQESTPTDRPYAWVAHKHLPKPVTMYIQSIIYKNNQSWKLALKSKRGTVNHRCM